MTFSSTKRFCGGALVIVALICLSSCAVPLAPGYQIEKQSITVRFVPGAPSHLAIRAQYRLANVGTAPLDSIEIGLPGEKGFGLGNLRVKIDGREVTPQRERSETSAPAEGETAAAETWPETWRIPFESRWTRRQHKNLVLEYDLAVTPATDPRMSISSNAFYLNDSGWFPDPISTKALFAKDVVRPDPSELIVDVPATFLATASGEPRGTHKARGETEYRFVIRKNDTAPFVLAGSYKQQIVSTRNGAVVFWSFDSLPPNQLQAPAKSIADTRKFLDDTFGAPTSRKPLTIVAVLPGSSPMGPDFGYFPGGGLFVNNGYLHLKQTPSDGQTIWQTIASIPVDVMFDETIIPRKDAWLLSGALLVYVGQRVDEEQGVGLSRSATISQLLRDYDGQHSAAVVKTPLNTSSDDSQAQQGIALDQAKLLMFALEDRCGRENLEHAIAHMVYALRGQEYGYNDFRAALEQECHQNLANFFDIWLNHTGIPPDFRARYDKSNSMK